MANYNNMTTFPATYNSSYYNIPSVRSFSDDLTTGLRSTLVDFSATHPHAHFALADVGALFHNIIANPAKFGIDEKYVNPPTACLTDVYNSEGVTRHLCSDPERHLFFDSYHPVREVHALIAELFLKAIVSSSV